jgi:hypothetical protein
MPVPSTTSSVPVPVSRSLASSVMNVLDSTSGGRSQDALYV